MRFAHRQDEGRRAESEADAAEHQRRKAAKHGGREPRQLLAQLGAEELEARAADVE